MTKGKNYIIRNKTTNALTLNESVAAGSGKKYVFEGVFTPISKEKNRNGRIYDKDEVLKHVSYLRDMIRKDGALLGELDHPNARFGIEIKEVSHKITDLWYDESKHAVMGRLELLDTPNGNIVKSLVESGYPLYVSSRAAGTVGPDSHVHIQQMFTYDIVATPGFPDAKLNMVSESFSPQVLAFLNESEQASSKVVNVAPSLSISDQNVIIEEVDENFEPKQDISNMTINEEEVKEPLTSKTKTPEQIDGTDGAQAIGVPVAEVGIVTETDKEEPTKDTEEKSQEDSQEPSGTSEDADLIVTIEPQFASDIISVDAEFKGDTKEEDSEKEEKSEEDKNDKESSEDQEESKEEPVKEETSSSEEPKKEDKEFTLAKSADIKKRNEETLNKYDNIIKDLKAKKAVKESIIEMYPFAVSLSESNFAKFAQLLDGDKAKVADYIYENAIIDIAGINEQWETPLKKEKVSRKKWMALASEEDKALFNAAPKEVQDSISESAKLFIFENKQDVDEFWNNTGLRQQKQRQILNEAFVNEYKDMIQPIHQNDELPYNEKYIQYIGEMLKD
jgi:hypothetical protein